MRRIALLLLFLPLLAFSQKVEVSIEALPAHHVVGGQGVAAAFAGQTGGMITIAGGCNFPESAASADAVKKYYDTVWYLNKNQWFERKVTLP